MYKRSKLLYYFICKKSILHRTLKGRAGKNTSAIVKVRNKGKVCINLLLFRCQKLTMDIMYHGGNKWRMINYQVSTALFVCIVIYSSVHIIKKLIIIIKKENMYGGDLNPSVVFWAFHSKCVGRWMYCKGTVFGFT